MSFQSESQGKPSDQQSHSVLLQCRSLSLTERVTSMIGDVPTQNSAPLQYIEAEEACLRPDPEESSAIQTSSFTLAQFNQLYRNDSLFSLGSSAYAMSEAAMGEDNQDLSRCSAASKGSPSYDIRNHGSTGAEVPFDSCGSSNSAAAADTSTAPAVTFTGTTDASPVSPPGASDQASVQASSLQPQLQLHETEPLPTPFSTSARFMIVAEQDRLSSSLVDCPSIPLRDHCTSPTTPWSEDAPCLPDTYSLTLTNVTSCDIDTTPTLSSFQSAVRCAISSLLQHGVPFAVIPEGDYLAIAAAAAAADTYAVDRLLRAQSVRFVMGPESPLPVREDHQLQPAQQQPVAAASGWNASVLVELIRSPFRQSTTSPRGSFTEPRSDPDPASSTAAMESLVASGVDLHLLSPFELARLQASASLRDTAALREILSTPEALPHKEVGGGRVEREACLRQAAGLGNVTWLQQLLSDNVDVNSTGEGSLRTPLMQAAASGSLHAVALLLHHGAFSQLKDRAGRTASQLAKGNSHTCVARLIKDANAKRDSLLMPIAPSEPSMTLASLRSLVDTVQRSVSSGLFYRKDESRLSGAMSGLLGSNSPRLSSSPRH